MGQVTLAQVTRCAASWSAQCGANWNRIEFSFGTSRIRKPSHVMEHLTSESSTPANVIMYQLLPIMWLVRATAFTLALFGMGHGFTLNMATSPGDGTMSRREAVSAIAASTTFAGMLVALPPGASAAAKISKSLGQESFRKIRDARQSLDSVDMQLRARKFEEVTALLENGPLTELEKSLVDLVKSNALPSDDKITVGTIRRYGLAADALIATGGLAAAARDGDGGEARRMLTLSKESLNDILTIAVNNNLNKTDP